MLPYAIFLYLQILCFVIILCLPYSGAWCILVHACWAKKSYPRVSGSNYDYFEPNCKLSWNFNSVCLNPESFGLCYFWDIILHSFLYCKFFTFYCNVYIVSFSLIPVSWLKSGHRCRLLIFLVPFSLTLMEFQIEAPMWDNFPLFSFLCSFTLWEASFILYCISVKTWDISY